MTLRTRLVVALVALSTVGLAVFGVSTYTLYQRSLAKQLDQDLAANSLGQAGRLARDAVQGAFDPSSCTSDSSTTTTEDVVVPPDLDGGTSVPGGALDAYAELRSSDGNVLACAVPVSSDSRPDLPDDLHVEPGQMEYLTVRSTEGSGTWRVLARVADSGGPATTQFRSPDGDLVDRTQTLGALEGATVVTAVRTAGLEESLARLVRIELVAAVLLLTALGGGAWFILRRGLRPLEEMADSAATITAGDLSERVEPADGRTEVGQLGLALNTMLDGIEDSFREREATEQRLRQFLADASHELRTPLTSIQGFAELFRLAAQGEPNDLERLDLPVVLARIEQDADRMKALVEDLLLLARLDAPKAVDPVALDLAVLAAEACSTAAALQTDRTISLEAPEPVPVRGVGDHLHRAIVNLVANAVKHTPPGTPIEVTVAANATTRHASVTVRDHGPGLDDDALAHVFDRFWQA
ncbi:MAG TPA: HAMP domain-containing sensor histidine kinase, partial [Acidimicrobiales bacterium]|nr:HAMP domain-containing sensor histidine kinase [Acidimicrobiales bacterium]